MKLNSENVKLATNICIVWEILLLSQQNNPNLSNRKRAELVKKADLIDELKIFLRENYSSNPRLFNFDILYSHFNELYSDNSNYCKFITKKITDLDYYSSMALNRYAKQSLKKISKQHNLPSGYDEEIDKRFKKDVLHGVRGQVTKAKLYRELNDNLDNSAKRHYTKVGATVLASLMLVSSPVLINKNSDPFNDSKSAISTNETNHSISQNHYMKLLKAFSDTLNAEKTDENKKKLQDQSLEIIKELYIAKYNSIHHSNYTIDDITIDCHFFDKNDPMDVFSVNSVNNSGIQESITLDGFYGKDNNPLSEFAKLGLLDKYISTQEQGIFHYTNATKFLHIAYDYVSSNPDIFSEVYIQSPDTERNE